MRRRPNKKLIGLFTIIGILVFTGIVLLLLRNKIFVKDDDLVVMYFEESIKGLSVGSQVYFKGVEVGKVAKIDLLNTSSDGTFAIPVLVKFNLNQTIKTLDFKKNKDVLDTIKNLINNGLRARLGASNLLTGQLTIELEMLPNNEAVMRNKYLNDVLEVPTVLSSKGEISKGFEGLPLKDITFKVNILLENINKYVPTILQETAEFTTQLNNRITTNSPEITNAINNLNKTIMDVGEAARSLKNLADYLERHPEALIKGKGGDY